MLSVIQIRMDLQIIPPILFPQCTGSHLRRGGALCAHFESVRCCRWLYWQLIFIRICASKNAVLHLEKAERDKLADDRAISGWDSAKTGLCHYFRVSDLSGLLLLMTIMMLLKNLFITNLKLINNACISMLCRPSFLCRRQHSWVKWRRVPLQAGSGRTWPPGVTRIQCIQCAFSAATHRKL